MRALADRPSRAHSAPAPRPASASAALRDLQRTVGNAAVTALVQRAHSADLGKHGLSAQDKKDLPDARTAKDLLAEFKQLQARWIAADNAVKAAGKDRPVTMADSGFTAEDDARLKEVMRLLDIRKRGDEADTLADNKQKGGLAAWFADVKDVPFLGRTARVHKLLAERLALAEVALKSQPAPTDGWLTENPSGLREPGQGLHSFGLAIDLNPATNPWLITPGAAGASEYEAAETSSGIRDVINRAVLLVLARTAKEEDLSSRPAENDKDRRVEASFDKLQGASDALQTYLLLAGADRRDDLTRLVTALGDKDPKHRTVEQWVKQIKADKKALQGHASGKQWSHPETGFLHLDKRLVKAMTDTGGAGLTWLGDDTIASGRDIMHFDMRGIGTINHIIDTAAGKTTYLGDG